MDKKEFTKELLKLGVKATEDQMNKLEIYYKTLVEWNEKINLTNITEETDVYLKHFYDSLTLIKAVDLNQVQNFCDVGTGAGFPGVVIKIFFPNIEVTLVDSLGKRITFLDELVKSLGLKGIKIYNQRAEDFSQNNREEYDVVTARAVMHLRKLIEICAPLVKVGGYLIPLKGGIDELQESKNAVLKLNLQLEEKIEFNLPIEKSNRIIYRFIKTSISSKIFPRKYSDILKKPL
ncbi:MAG: 16S rRNA (guanine(527)-N(7))-methyltransferase RsmG [Bacilli bacterium]|nr:16S rRNA (guanine(527)-N(7))-methyltransferase RsmG [Bacilli bacterium]